jgi:hypothetical protein
MRKTERSDAAAQGNRRRALTAGNQFNIAGKSTADMLQVKNVGIRIENVNLYHMKHWNLAHQDVTRPLPAAWLPGSASIVLSVTGNNSRHPFHQMMVCPEVVSYGCNACCTQNIQTIHAHGSQLCRHAPATLLTRDSCSSAFGCVAYSGSRFACTFALGSATVPGLVHARLGGQRTDQSCPCTPPGLVASVAPPSRTRTIGMLPFTHIEGSVCASLVPSWHISALATQVARNQQS